MNKVRRKEIDNIKNQIEELRNKLTDIQEALESVLNDEQEAFDNIPENLQESERGEKISECIENLEEAQCTLDIDLDEIIELLDNAKGE